MAPWIFFLFIGVLDFGFYSFAAISTANAARVAAQYTSTGSGTAADANCACFFVLQELRSMPNVPRTMTGCNSGSTVPSECSALPVVVSVTSLNAGADGQPASEVAVTYETVPMMPIPGLGNKLTITRVAQMRLRTD
jgi:hypothetical protein